MVSSQGSAVGRRVENQQAIGNQTAARISNVVRLRAFVISVTFSTARMLLCLYVMFIAFSVEAAQENSLPPAPAAASFGYKFENPRFYVSSMEIDLDQSGGVELRFKRGESEDIIDRKLKLLPSTFARIRQLYEITRFLDSSEEYQDKKDFSHLGWVSLFARQGQRERLAKFNYTTNKEIAELSDIFRGIATQEMHLFDIETSQQFQPLELPSLLEALESDLRLQRVAEPEQLIPVLREISGNDTQPLIARNHATRIIDSIKKGKFKSPVKK